MNCCLWINGKKISDLKGIRENFNITDIRGYYLGGRLADWLYCHDGEYEARLVEAIPKGTNPDKMLHDIFCNSYKRPDYHVGRKDAAKAFIFACSYGGSYARALGSAKLGSMNLGSMNLGSMNLGSAKMLLTSFVTTSAKAIIGSARRTSFGSGRHEHEFEFKIGSFLKTSFALGSFNLGSFILGSFAAGSFAGGSYKGADLVGGEDGGEPFDKAAALAYFTSEPLNMYGYGIHLI